MIFEQIGNTKLRKKNVFTSCILKNIIEDGDMERSTKKRQNVKNIQPAKKPFLIFCSSFCIVTPSPNTGSI